jgi:hypothetical protein
VVVAFAVLATLWLGVAPSTVAEVAQRSASELAAPGKAAQLLAPPPERAVVPTDVAPALGR